MCYIVALVTYSCSVSCWILPCCPKSEPLSFSFCWPLIPFVCLSVHYNIKSRNLSTGGRLIFDLASDFVILSTTWSRLSVCQSISTKNDFLSWFKNVFTFKINHCIAWSHPSVFQSIPTGRDFLPWFEEHLMRSAVPSTAASLAGTGGARRTPPPPYSVTPDSVS